VFDFDNITRQQIGYYGIKPALDGLDSMPIPRQWIVSASDDRSLWHTLDRRIVSYSENVNELVFPLQASRPYRYYRFTFPANEAASDVFIRELEMYPIGSN